VTRADRARAIARAAAYGGTGLVGLGGAAVGLLLAEAALARRAIGLPTDSPLNADGDYLPVRGPSVGRPLRLAVLGDSGATGLGVDLPEQTPGAVIAQQLADSGARPVTLRSVAVVGAQSGDLPAQIDRVLPWRPDAAVIVVGANDVTHRVTPTASVRLLAAAVRRLRDAEVEVIVGTCPDLGTVQPIPHPLKWVARHWSRSLAAAQMVGVVEAGGRSVALADLLGADFAREPETYFGVDQFHPSVTGYQAMADALAPSVLASLGYGEEPADPSAGTVPTIAVEQAAAAAADRPGTELSALEGHREGRSRWAAVRLPGRPRLRRSTTPADEEGQESQDASEPT
jgi:lysophospholipase L1-like esterase